jgi:hypothetical protein
VDHRHQPELPPKKSTNFKINQLKNILRRRHYGQIPIVPLYRPCEFSENGINAKNVLICVKCSYFCQDPRPDTEPAPEPTVKLGHVKNYIKGLQQNF